MNETMTTQYGEKCLEKRTAAREGQKTDYQVDSKHKTSKYSAASLG